MHDDNVYVNPCFLTLIWLKINSSSDNPWEQWIVLVMIS
jgi:hypothetical protein